MTKKRMLVVLTVVTVGLVVSALLYLHSLPKTPLRAGYDRVRKGMTTEEVHAAMKEFGPFDPYLSDVDGGSDRVEVYFKNDQAMATIHLTRGRVMEKCYYQESWGASMLEDVRERLGF
jgi:hypothetical protein